MKEHPLSIILPHCWVCGAKFIDSGGVMNREDHHLIPRAFGGEDGPEVSLCETHHTIGHRVADALYHGRPHFALISHESPEAKKKLEWIGSRIYNARIQYQNDPNKQVKAQASLNKTHQAMMAKLKPIYGNKSREFILLKALELLYKSHFRE